MKRKFISVLMISALLFSHVEAARIDSVKMTDGVWVVEGTANDNSAEVIMSVTGGNGLADIRQQTIENGNKFSFELPEIEDSGIYTIKVRDSADTATYEKTMYLADNSKKGIMYSRDFSGEYSEWITDGTAGVTGTEKFRLGTQGTGVSKAIVDGFTKAMDYRLTLEISGAKAGMNSKVLFRYIDDENYCYLKMPFSGTGGNGNYEFGVVEKGKDTVMYQKKVSEGFGKVSETYDIKIECLGYWITAYINDVLVGRMYCDTVTNGTIGVVAENGQVYFDNVLVENMRDVARTGKIRFENDLGHELYSIPENGEVTVKSRAVNISEDECFEGLLAVAVYDGERLISVKSDNRTVNPGEETEYTVELVGIDENKRIKVFLWDDFLGQKPLNNGEIINSNEKYFNIYVDDDFEGKNSDGSFEKTYKTISEAVTALKEIKANYGLGEDGIRIWIREGEYELDEGIDLSGEEVSGTVMQPVVFSAYKGEKVIVKGSKSIDINTLKKVSEDDSAAIERIKDEFLDEIYVADIPYDIPEIKKFNYVHGSDMYTNLIFNGKTQELAKYPNSGYIKTGKVYFKDGSRITSKDTAEWDEIRANNESILMDVSDESVENWQTATDAWLGGYFYCDWSYENVRMFGADDTDGKIEIGIPEYFYINEDMDFCVYNLLEELDEPGEWYLDRSNKKLYFYPPEELNGNSKLEISLIEDELLKVYDAHDIIVNGIDFENSSGSGVEILVSDRVTVTYSDVKNIGGSGICVSDSENVNIRNAVVHDVGANGIGLYGCGDRYEFTDGNCKVENCEVYNFSKNSKSYNPGINLNNSVGCRVANNSIHDAPHSAIIFSGCENVIEYNEIYNVLTEATDAGAIYCGRSYIQRGNVIRYNYLHDIVDKKGAMHSVAGIYLDDMFSGTTVKSNMLNNVDSGIFLNGGRDTVIKNNIIMNKTAEDFGDATGGKYSILMRDTGLFSFRLESTKELIEQISLIDLENPRWQKYPEITDYPEDAPGAPVRNVVENNIIWNHHDVKAYDGYLKYSPLGENAVEIMAPGFSDEENGDLTVREDSEIFEVLPGFEIIPFDKIGVKR